MNTQTCAPDCTCNVCSRNKCILKCELYRLPPPPEVKMPPPQYYCYPGPGYAPGWEKPRCCMKCKRNPCCCRPRCNTCHEEPCKCRLQVEGSCHEECRRPCGSCCKRRCEHHGHHDHHEHHGHHEHGEHCRCRKCYRRQYYSGHKFRKECKPCCRGSCWNRQMNGCGSCGHNPCRCEKPLGFFF